MLEGVNVVETITRRAVPWYILALVAIVGLMFVSDFAVKCIRAGKGKGYKSVFGDDSISRIFAAVCDVLVIACMITGGLLLYDGYNTPKTTYRVTVDESASFVEFHDRYEILLEDGDEYIVKEITKAEDALKEK